MSKRTSDLRLDDTKRLKISDSAKAESAFPDSEEIDQLLAKKRKDIADRLSRLNHPKIQENLSNSLLKTREDQHIQNDVEKQSEHYQKLDEAKRRIALTNTSHTVDAPSVPTFAIPFIYGRESNEKRAPTELHPSVLALQDPTRSSVSLPSVVPRFATVKANIKMVENATKKQLLRAKKMAAKEEKAEKEKSEKEILEEFKNNPYFDNSLKASAAFMPRVRASRTLKFAQPGKFIDAANQVRAEQQMEKLKMEIAEKIATAGLEAEIELVSDLAIRKEEPPRVEWWDAQLLPNQNYKDLDQGPIEFSEEVVTNLIHHPIPILPPDEKGKVKPLPLMLTVKERKKLRRQRRQEAMKERQDKIRMGLLPPDQPKMRISNLMQVLGTEAVQDPTQMEKVVRQQMAARQAAAKKHDDLTRLTEEQRKEKKRDKLTEDLTNGVHVAVFRISDLSNPQHKFKININTQHFNLTGVCIIYHKMNVCIVEGGPKGIKAYKKILLRRIDWTGQKNTDEDEDDEGPQAGVMSLKNTKECALVWEGVVAKSAFKHFKLKTYPTDFSIREFLDSLGIVHYWDAAKNYAIE